MDIESILLSQFNASGVHKVAVIQSLWSGYGEISRYGLDYPANKTEAKQPHSVIVKLIQPQSRAKHPRGWNSQTSYQRKITSYQVEAHWYSHWAHLCSQKATLPECYGVFSSKASLDQSSIHGDEPEQKMILMSDLDAQGFHLRYHHVSLHQARACLTWLAYFHGQFLQYQPQKGWMLDLWKTGTYWHLSTRQEEFENMSDSPLKQAASQIDTLLNTGQFQTLLHGDAKVANFCFSKNDQVAAVDFQYVGAGCGMKDVVYFLGSCLTENECEMHYLVLLEHYFTELKQAVDEHHPQLDVEQIEIEWRGLFTFAWADFQRFLLGWSPDHPKNTLFSQRLTQDALISLAMSHSKNL